MSILSVVISALSIAAFAVTTVYMLVRARFAATRRVVMVPVLMTAAEVMMFGLVSGITNPAVLLLLIAARAAVIVVCMMAMRNDREAYKARVRMRNRFRAEMYNTMEPLRLVRRQRAAARIDVA